MDFLSLERNAEAMWFEQLTGFREVDGDDVRARFRVDGQHLVSERDGRRLRFGRFETPPLTELRKRSAGITRSSATTVREWVGDVQEVHRDPANAGATIQVASQFNTLEMVSEWVTPEAGVDGYSGDPTQGPACAIACGAGTIYRNYFAPVGDQIGQSAGAQIDCSAGVADALGVDLGFRNGYLLPAAEALATAGQAIEVLDEAGRTELMGLLRIGLQHDTQVTFDPSLLDVERTVSQAYCSGVPIGYSNHSATAWQPLARLVLNATYEATFAAAVETASRTGNNKLFLTLIGGGVFRNPEQWVLEAIRRALGLYHNAGLDVTIVSYGRRNPGLRELVGSA